MIVLYLRLVYNHLSCWDSLCFLWTHSVTHTSPNRGVQCNNSSLCGGTHASPNTAFLNVLYTCTTMYTVMWFMWFLGHLQHKYTMLNSLLCFCTPSIAQGQHRLCTVQAFRLWAVTRANRELEHFLIPKSQTVDYLSLNRFRCFRGDYVVQFLDVLFHKRIPSFTERLHNCCSYWLRIFCICVLIIVLRFCVQGETAFIVLFVIHCVLRDCYSSVLCFIVFECCWSAWCGWAPSSPGDWSKCGALYDQIILALCSTVLVV